MKKAVVVGVVLLMLTPMALAQEKARETRTTVKRAKPKGPGLFAKIAAWMENQTEASRLPYKMQVGLSMDFTSYPSVKEGSNNLSVFFKNKMKENWAFTPETELSVSFVSVPVDSYTTLSGTKREGKGVKNFLSVQAALWLHMNLLWKNLSIGGGASYNKFLNGTILVADATNPEANGIEYPITMVSDEPTAFAGAQIFAQLFEKFYLTVGAKYVYYINSKDYAYTASLALAYGI